MTLGKLDVDCCWSTGKAGEKLGDAFSKLNKEGDSDTLTTVSKTFKDVSSQASKLATDYDLGAKVKQALGVAGELADAAIGKGIELDKEYKVTDKVKDQVKKTIDSAKSSSKM